MNYSFINIIGYGFVGGAVGHLCKRNNIRFCVCDVTPKEEQEADHVFSSIGEIVRNSEQANETNIYFVCVPTPSKDSGECDTSIVDNVIESLSRLCTKTSIVYVKSTLQPGTTKSLHSKYGNEKVSIFFCPEFLREKTANADMYDATFALVGVTPDQRIESTTHINIFRLLYKHNDTFQVIVKPAEICELFKYTINVFLAVKVWYFNEVNTLCDKFNVQYDDLKSLFDLEPRIGTSHTDVPGHDGHYGFGGACLVKETKGMRYLQHALVIPDKVLSDILERNEEIRRITF